MSQTQAVSTLSTAVQGTASSGPTNNYSSTADIVSTNVDPVRSIPLLTRISHDKPNLTYDLRGDKDFKNLFAFFENVSLLSAVFTVWIPLGAKYSVEFAVCESATIPSELDEAPVYSEKFGGAYGRTEHTFTYTPESGFGKVVKGINLGNPSPVFRLRALGDSEATTITRVRAVFKVRAHGFGIISAGTIDSTA